MIDGKKNMKKIILKNSFMFFFYFVYGIIPLTILYMLNINTNNFNNLEKNIYLISTKLIYLLFAILVYRKELKEDLIKLKGNYVNNINKFMPIYIIGVLLMAISNTIISNITGTNLSGNEITIRNSIKLFPVYMTFSTVIFAPIVEEITFRKTFKNIITNKYFFVIISGIMFGIVHASSPFGINEYLMTIPYVLMGMVLSYIYYKSDNIFISMTIHALHNLILLLIQFIGG